MCAKGLKLVSRHKIFCKLLNEVGLEGAKKRMGYHPSSVRRLMSDERTWIYLMILIDETASKLGLSKAEELKKLQKMIDDPNIPGSSRIAAQQKLVEWLHAEPDAIKGGFMAIQAPYQLEEAIPKPPQLEEPKREDRDTSYGVGEEHSKDEGSSVT